MRMRLLPLALVMVIAGACGNGGPAPEKPASSGPSLEIVDPPATVKGNVVTLPATVEGVKIVKADGDTTGNTGHFHVFIDRDPIAAGQVIGREKGIVHTTDNPIKLYGLTTGAHRIVVVLGDGTHKRIHPDLEEEVSVTVQGPAVQATAPATAKVGEPVTVDVTVQGFTIKAADGDTSGTSGHLHLFVDREPTAAGQPIPREPGVIHTTETSVKVPDLAAGEHTIWVVAGDGNHVPLSPPVIARVAVTVQ